MLHLSAAITVYVLSVTLLLGLVLGSFANCMAGRLAGGQSFVRGRSHCPACGHDLAARDLIPLLSWLLLKGRCRYCGAPIAARYPLTELACALACVGLVLRFDVSWYALCYIILAVLLLAVALVDLDSGLIPDGLLIAAAVNVLLLTVLTAGWRDLLSGLIAALVIVVSLLALVLVMDRVLKKDSMGGGDIKLFFVLCLYLDWQRGLLLVILSCVVGLAFALLSSRTTGDPDNPRAFPFGPAICLAAYLTLLAGEPLTQWYASLL